jgi:glycosyltransferase involved in cell wall biosynthesis
VTRTIRVVHVITGLQVGGAELALQRLLEATDRSRIDPVVVSLTSGGGVVPRIASLGIPVHDLAMDSALDLPSVLVRLRRLLQRERIDVVQTWMHHADLIGGLAARSARRPAVWGLRMGNLDAESAVTKAVARANARLAGRVPTAIVACSSSVAEEHVLRGYPRDRLVVIPNGYDTRGGAGVAPADLRRSLGVPAEALVVGRVGRWHAMKDYPGLLTAVAPLLEELPTLHVVLVGDGVDGDNPKLAALRAALPDPTRVHLLGRRDDMSQVYGALDVLCSSSASGEGFPNVIAEAMLAQVPVVTTDVGESATIVGGTGVVVAPAPPPRQRGGGGRGAAAPPGPTAGGSARPADRGARGEARTRVGSPGADRVQLRYRVDGAGLRRAARAGGGGAPAGHACRLSRSRSPASSRRRRRGPRRRSRAGRSTARSCVRS